jgi:hypothetical protein
VTERERVDVEVEARTGRAWFGGRGGRGERYRADPTMRRRNGADRCGVRLRTVAGSGAARRSLRRRRIDDDGAVGVSAVVPSPPLIVALILTAISLKANAPAPVTLTPDVPPPDSATAAAATVEVTD